MIVLVLLAAAAVLELFVIVQVAQEIGVLETLAALIIVCLVGVWLVKRAGLSVLVRMQDQLVAGRMPTNELVDGALLLVSGALLVIPGFVTDSLGVLLLFPPTRVLVRRRVIRSYRNRIASGTAGRWAKARVWHRVVVDVDSREDERWPDQPGPAQSPRPRGELEP